MQNTVYIVDDDVHVSSSIARLLEVEGYTSYTFNNGEDFLKTNISSSPSCLLLDWQLPDTNGIEVIKVLVKRGVRVPVIFMSGVGTIPVTVETMKLGAREFLTKPIPSETLLQAIAGALVYDHLHIKLRLELAELNERYASLTNREKELFAHLVTGRLIKQIAGDLELSEITIKVHKHNIMQKMQTRTLADLVRAFEKLQNQ